MNVAITFSFNQKYIKYCYALCNSIISNVKTKHTVYARCVNVCDTDVQQLRSKYPDYTFIQDNKNLGTELAYNKKEIPANTNIVKSVIYDRAARKKLIKNNEYKHDVCVSKYSEEIVYTCHSRFANILELTEQDVIICLDVDSIFNKDINLLLNDIVDYDVMIYTDHTGNCNEEGTLILNCTSDTLRYIRKVWSDIQHDKHDWDVDGKSLTKHLPIVKRKQLDLHLYKNKSFDPEAVIWSGDSHVKNDIRYKELL